MSRCFVCNEKMNDYDFNSCKDICGICQRVIDEDLAEYSCVVEEDEVDTLLEVITYAEEGVRRPAPMLDYYDNLDAFDSESSDLV